MALEKHSKEKKSKTSIATAEEPPQQASPYRKLGHKPLSAESKQVIINVYEKIREKNPKLFVEEAANLAAEYTGSSAKTVFRIKKELKTTNKLSTPPRTRKEGRPMGNRIRRLNKYDDTTLRAIRAKINELYSETGKPPTMKRLMASINAEEGLPTFNNERTLGLLVNDMGYKFGANKVTSAKTASRLLKLAQGSISGVRHRSDISADRDCGVGHQTGPQSATIVPVCPLQSTDVMNLGSTAQTPGVISGQVISSKDSGRDSEASDVNPFMDRSEPSSGSRAGMLSLEAGGLLELSSNLPIYAYENPPSFPNIGSEQMQDRDDSMSRSRGTTEHRGSIESEQMLFQCL